MTAPREHATIIPPGGVGCRRLAGAVAVIVAVWCGLLPWLGRTGLVERHVRRLERQEVDAAAMYYTELHRLPLRPAWIDDRLVLWP
jgi:hypothetical protein